MIDLHTHILPNIDDGASNLEEALEMTRILAAQGVKGAVCTPHYYPTEMTIEDFVNLRREAAGLMKDSDIPLFLASETYLHEYLLYYRDLDALKIEGSNYLLLELPFDKVWKEDVYSNIQQLINRFDISPIIAHIERYPLAKEKHINNLKEIGCIFQLNTSSLLDKTNKRKALKYMRKGFIDVLGSDCHNTSNRIPQVEAPLNEIRKHLGDEFCNSLIDKSKAVIQGLNIF